MVDARATFDQATGLIFAMMEPVGIAEVEFYLVIVGKWGEANRKITKEVGDQSRAGRTGQGTLMMVFHFGKDV